MKPSKLRGGLWLACVPLFTCGAWAVYEFSAHNDRIAAESLAAWEASKPPRAETWLDYRLSAESAFEMPKDLRLVPGAPEVAKILYVPPPPEPVPVNLAAEARKLRIALEGQLMFEFVSLASGPQGAIDQASSMGIFKLRLGERPPESRPSFSLFPGQMVSECDLAWKSVGMRFPHEMPVILQHCRLVELSAGGAVFAVSTPGFARLYAQALSEDAEAAAAAVNTEGMALIEIEKDGGVIEREESPEMIISQLEEHGRERAKVTIEVYRDPLSEETLADLKKLGLAKAEAAAAAASETIFESYEDGDKIVHIGTNDMNDATMEQLEAYVETYFEPGSNTAAGLKISRSLPQGTANLMRRFGGREGDIIKAINGDAISDALSLRAAVRHQRDQGTETFVITFLRDGLEQSKTLHAKKSEAK